LHRERLELNQMKTYCISDIHAHLDNLERFIDTLEKDDRIFVLGDVVDKGPEAIKCLDIIMKDNRFRMLLGNHEYMMFNLLSLEPGTYEYKEAYKTWVDWNEGGDTLDQYNKLPKYKQIEIYNYIKRLPLNIPNIKVGDRTFYLVHSCPHSDIKLTMEDVGYSDLKIGSYVWDRVNPLDKMDIENQIVIAGHTIVQEYLGLFTDKIEPVFDCKDNINKAHYIDIDGGLATGLPNSKLISLCLDDLSYSLY